MTITNEQVREFWGKNPVAAPRGEVWGSYDFFHKFDNRREASNCEPWDFSNRIHGYDKSNGKKVLDVGCGNGYVLAQYGKYGAETYGVDLTETSLKLSRKRFALCKLQGEFILTDGNTLPFPDEHFDIVCSMGVLHHIEDPTPMVAEIYRVLKKGGDVILMLYNRHSFKYQVLFRYWKYFGPSGRRGKSLKQILNMNDGLECPLAKVFSKAAVRTLFSRFGNVEFVVNQLSLHDFFLNLPLLSRIMNKLLPNCSESFVARRWGWNLYARAKKNTCITNGIQLTQSTFNR